MFFLGDLGCVVGGGFVVEIGIRGGRKGKIGHKVIQQGDMRRNLK